ncbi:conserved protein of unknown function [Methylorubrum extorquens]|uniref:Uncharacterized protein n=1 Tax=Methylorubrum extorquens TaxID=408 RepID=A0A2N9AN12_METEX|nr:conserved protein of unknown function [Methylorubrum extorquens]
MQSEACSFACWFTAAGRPSLGLQPPSLGTSGRSGLLGFARGIGLDEATVRDIYEAVGREAMVTGASDDERMAEIRKRMLLAVA